MAELLLEIFSEEIPARMQGGGARELERSLVGALSERGLLFEGASSFFGPRRLTLTVAGLPAKQPDVSEERKGPRVDAPEKALEGFLRSTGLTLDQCAKQSDGKGEFYVAIIKREGRATEEVLAELLPQILEQMTWPKSMRWGTGSTRWVRPIHSILCTFDGELVPFEFAGIRSGTSTRGHRFLAPQAIEVRRFDDYRQKLADAFVVLDAAQRKEIISHEAGQKVFALGLEIIGDEGLLDEVAGLVEWPVPLLGRINDAFMDLPAEVLQTSMRTHQKFFAVRDPASGRMANRFVVVANIAATDDGLEIIAGNERVLRARLSDAKFFWDQDRRRPLDARVSDLKNVTFHARAGTMLDRVHRMKTIASVLARDLQLDPAKPVRAAQLAKADLTTGIVGEFPELQGTMGRYYALHDGEDSEVANAIGDHYKPLGPSDRVPTEPVSIVVALADKVDVLVTLWHAGEKPTGSKDPFALRRAGLGIIRIILENGLRLSLRALLCVPLTPLNHDGEPVSADVGDNKTVAEILEFLADRLKVALRSEGTRHDLIDAVFSLGGEDDLVRLVARVRALTRFLETPDGANLLAAYRRAVNILKIEEKRDACVYRGAPEAELLEAPEERLLFEALRTAETRIAPALRDEKFEEAMTAMAQLREPVDQFFDKVIVNAPDAKLRKNRLLILSWLRDVMHATADFSRIEG
jgi:glycyl-tRNA synthetase beta chain